MNLILFSSFFGDKKVHDFIMEKSKNRDPKICVIPSFTNFYGVTSTGEYRALVKMGFNHDNISMFDVGYLWDETKVDSLMNNDVIILGGGNTFLFQWLLRTHGMLNILNKFASNGGILIGESAGSIMMSKTVEIARFADQDIVGSGNTDGIGLVDFNMKPHFGSWIKNLGDFVDWSHMHDGDLYCLFDGGYIIVDDEEITPYGDYIRFNNGKVKDFCLRGHYDY